MQQFHTIIYDEIGQSLENRVIHWKYTRRDILTEQPLWRLCVNKCFSKGAVKLSFPNLSLKGKHLFKLKCLWCECMQIKNSFPNLSLKGKHLFKLKCLWCECMQINYRCVFKNMLLIFSPMFDPLISWLLSLNITCISLHLCSTKSKYSW